MVHSENQRHQVSGVTRQASPVESVCGEEQRLITEAKMLTASRTINGFDAPSTATQTDLHKSINL